MPKKYLLGSKSENVQVAYSPKMGDIALLSADSLALSLKTAVAIVKLINEDPIRHPRTKKKNSD